MKRTMVLGILLLAVVFANGDHQAIADEGKALVDSGISCDELTNEQLETIGEYFMEQMHPGEQHEAMHASMGIEEGTEYHEQFHVNIAKMMYCGQGGMMGGDMMGNMMQGMMGRDAGSPYGPGMMNYSTSPDVFGWNIFDILIWILLVGLILLVYLHIWDKLKGVRGRR